MTVVLPVPLRDSRPDPLGTTLISPEQWLDYSRTGFLRLGQVLSADQIAELTQRADDLAVGSVENPNIEIQRDTGGRYDELPDAVRAAQGDLLYRKVQGLETDDLYSAVLTADIFREIAGCHYGRHAPVSLFRAMVMNKPAGQGTVLPWHQDGGDVWALDRDPLVTIWIALDDATAANGCVEVIPGSHRLGLLSAVGSTVSDENAARYCPADQVLALEVPAGHAVLMHNWLIHRSGVNPTSIPRRAFTACYMDGRTRNVLTGGHFPMVFGTSPTAADHFVAQSLDELRHYRDTATAATEYALSLKAENDRLQVAVTESAGYTRSLESAVARLTVGRLPVTAEPAVIAEQDRSWTQRARALWTRLPAPYRRRAHLLVQRLPGRTGG